MVLCGVVVCGVWCAVCGVWCVVCGVVVSGVWCVVWWVVVVCRAVWWCVVCGVRCAVCGVWSVGCVDLVWTLWNPGLFCGNLVERFVWGIYHRSSSTRFPQNKPGFHKVHTRSTENNFGAQGFHKM